MVHRPGRDFLRDRRSRAHTLVHSENMECSGAFQNLMVLEWPWGRLEPLWSLGLGKSLRRGVWKTGRPACQPADLSTYLRAALAFLNAARRVFAAIIRARPSGLRRRFFLAAFAGAGVAAACGFREAALRFLCAADMRRRAAGLTMRLGASSRANATVLSKPGGPVMRTRTPPWDGSAAIQPRCGCARRCPAAATAALMRSRLAEVIPLVEYGQGRECGQLAGQAARARALAGSKDGGSVYTEWDREVQNGNSG